MTALVHPRHQAQRGRPGPDRRARRDPRRAGSGARRAAPARTAARPGVRIAAVAGRRSAPGRRSALRDRLHAYAEKAMREAGDRTTWTEPDEAYEPAVHARRRRGVRRRAGAAASSTRLSADRRTPAGSNALAAKLVALTMPGVPDVYQGTELWDQSLVDPDNRRPVDFDAPRRGARRRAEDPACAEARRSCSPRSTLRRDRPELFTTYAPVRRDRRGRRARARLRPRRRRRRRHPAPARAGRRGGWGDTTLALPAGPGPTCSPVSGADGARVAELLADLPRRAAGAEDP